MENNLSLYRIFYTTAGIGNISSAAKALYISQPAVSKAISKLEQNLNVTLFIRSPKGVSLTYEGQMLFEKVKAAFESIHDGEELIRHSTELGGGHLRIGVSTTLCKYVLLPYLKDFIATNPHIKISIDCQSTYQTLTLLESGKIDIGLIGKPNGSHDVNRNSVFYEIAEIEDIFVASKNYLEHQRIREAKSDHASILRNSTLILLDKENMTRQYIDNYFLEHHFEPEQVIEVTSMDLLIEFARIGLGVACVIGDFVIDDIKREALVQIPLKSSIPSRSIGFMYMKSNINSNALNRFISFLSN